jgi:hypothetical protein
MPRNPALEPSLSKPRLRRPRQPPRGSGGVRRCREPVSNRRALVVDRPIDIDVRSAVCGHRRNALSFLGNPQRQHHWAPMLITEQSLVETLDGRAGDRRRRCRLFIPHQAVFTPNKLLFSPCLVCGHPAECWPGEAGLDRLPCGRRQGERLSGAQTGALASGRVRHPASSTACPRACRRRSSGPGGGTDITPTKVA